MIHPFFPESGDPTDAKDYTIKMLLPTGDSPSVVTVTAVDDADAPIVSGAPTIGTVVTGSIGSQVYGATFSVTGGTPGQYYSLRSRWLTSLGKQYDATMRLLIEQR